MITFANETSNEACYLIGFSPTEVIPGPYSELMELFGIQYEDAGGIRIWYRLVDRSEFEGPIAEKNLADLQWLTPRILAHEKAVEILSQLGPFYPTQFGTLFSSTDRIADLVGINEEILRNYFVKVEGKVELGLKVFANWEAATKYFLVANNRNDSGKGVGISYLAAKKFQRSRSPEIRNKLLQIVEVVQGILRENGVHFVSRACRTAGGPIEEQILNLAFLIARDQRSEIEAMLGQFTSTLGDPDLFRFEFSGPWPTYSFCPELNSPSTQGVHS